VDADVVAGGGGPGRADDRGKAENAQSATGASAAGSKIDVAYVAQLARLELTAEETALFQSQLGKVLEHASRLRELDLEGVEAAAHAFPVYDVLRPDEPRPGLTQEEALRNAPRTAHGLFIVPKVVE
jgi:aspartyl-tRNA(Asn)/glutamyl-tRNA(Gln) amidotransferase subunit C